jgi:phosphate transport system substrate-binding protein
MKNVQRIVGFILLLTLFNVATPTFAQDDEPIQIIGSRTVTDLFAILETESGLDTNIDIEPTGTTSGFATFCAGGADIVGTVRPISVEEDAACIQNGVEYSEYLLGYDILAIVANRDVDFADCLTTFDLDTIFAPSAQGQTIDWLDTQLTEESLPLTTYLPPDNSSIYGLLDGLVDGVGLRGDANLESSMENVFAAVSDNSGAIGVVTLNSVADSDDVNVIELSNDELGQCFGPSVETVEGRQYTGANRLFLYVNQMAAENDNIKDILGFVTAASAAEIITQAGFSAPSSEVYNQNETILLSNEIGRQFSLDVANFEIPPNLQGTIAIGGNANLETILQAITTQFTSQFPAVTVNQELDGQAAGYRKLCNGEIDILAATSELPQQDSENCEANGITTSVINLGSQAVALVANGGDEYLRCLSKDQVFTIWEAGSNNEITLWNSIDGDFPESTITLFAPSSGSVYADWLLTPAEGAVVPIRIDTEINDDPLYRAAATANVSGALTFMSWDEYVQVLENNQANIKVLEIDGGDGCVTPSVESISDNSYPYSVASQLIISLRSLSAAEVQSFLWFVFSDENFSQFDQSGLIGITFAELPAIRNNLQAIFADAIAVSLTPESTPEVTAEPESTAEVTVEPNAEGDNN